MIQQSHFELPYDSAIPLLGIHQDKTIIRKHTCTFMFTAALFTTARTWKQAKHPAAEERIKVCIYNGILHLLSHFSRVQLSANLWTIAHQAPPFMGFSRQEYWSGLPCPPPGHLPKIQIKPISLMSPALAGRFFSTNITWEWNTIQP